ENAATFNNAALAHFALFGVTNDRDELTRGTDKLDRAVALSPSNTILLSNGASMVFQAAAGDVAGPAVDFRALKSPPEGDVLAYLYRTPAERAAVSARVAAHPGAVKARAYAEKLVVLAPRRDESYRLPADLAECAGDTAGLRAAADRAEKAGLELADEAREYREYLTGASDAKKGEAVRAGVTRSAAALAPARAAGGRTFAVAVGRYVRVKTAAWAFGEPADPDELVKLADEAHAAVPSAGTQTALESALLLRAHLALAAAAPGYAAAAAKTRRSFGPALVDYVLADDGPHRDRAAANPDVRRLAALALEEFDRDPAGADARDWARVKAAVPDRAATVAEKARANVRHEARARLNRALTPYFVATALESHRDLLLAGKPDEAKQVIAALAAAGTPVP
ncbi:MAG TPA: hypothetical protein VH092_29990, partial [Urbifossiella sp.]|nr:hypothetical protein [Urbifossiella sp.]